MTSRKNFLFSLPASLLLFFSYNNLNAQNSLTGDGFGGRGWYVAHNYQAGAYSAYTVCGSNNQLYAWGSNMFGNLGNGTYNSTIVPIAVTGMSNVKFCTAGYMCAAIKSDNSAWVWGISSYGNAFSAIPEQVLDNVKFADAGANHVVFVKNDGTVWGVGSNFTGELGNGTLSTTGSTAPVQMTGINNAVRAIAVGSCSNYIPPTEVAATIILLSDSTIKITGGGNFFQPVNSTIPVTLPGLSNIIDIKGNDRAAFALNSSGEVFSFGKSFLGLPTTPGSYTPPTRLSFPSGAASIVALSANDDGATCLALDSNHNVYGWGYNWYGQLGDGTNVEVLVPKLIATDAVDILAGETFSYILKSDNSLWATGSCQYGDPTYGSIWMNLPNITRYTWTRLDPTIAPINLCPPALVLPVELLNFTCSAIGSTAKLTWTSSEEIDLDRFEIEYCIDGFHFTKVAASRAKGSNSKYYFNHYQTNNRAFYRLKMIDKDSNYKYSETRSINFNAPGSNKIIPNPAMDAITVYCQSRSYIESIQISNIQGKVLKTTYGLINGQPIDISDLPGGTYIMQLKNQGSQPDYKMFIKL